MTEQWAPVPGWVGEYSVSDLGRVRSEERTVMGPRRFPRRQPKRILKPASSRGYQRVVLQRAGTKESWAIHRLVLLAYVGPPPAGHEGCHGDGDKANNALTNLRWDTRSANHKERTRHGANPNALKTHCPAGHAYTSDNTLRSREGYRKCKTCHYTRRNEWKRASRETKRKAS